MIMAIHCNITTGRKSSSVEVNSFLTTTAVVAKLCVSTGEVCKIGTLSLLCSTSVPKVIISVLPWAQVEVKVCDVSIDLDSVQ